MYGEELNSENEEIVANSEKLGDQETTILETVSEE